MQADINIEGEGFFKIQGQTDAGWDWVADNVASAEDGVAYSDDQRYTQEIAQGATDEGLIVGVNGFQFVSGGAQGEPLDA